MRVIAHRTLPLDAPENSLAGIRRAHALGADSVEIDVRLTRDHVCVLSHDPTLWRLARVPVPVALASSRWLRARRRTDSGEPIATLQEAVDGLPPGMHVVLDVKADTAMGPAISLLRELDRLDWALLWSRDPATVRLACDLAPHCERALLRNTFDDHAGRRYVHDAVAAHANAVSLHHRGTTRAVVDAAHSAGLLVYSWVTDDADHARVLATGVDGINTDWPAQARRLIDEAREDREGDGDRRSEGDEG